ncbi:hypothetical protein HYPSUDRAFT_131263 [Hypholoma sublateritium FD-334 SS-4]|uniref:Uncharacterized protein n=1 Tax=Hypholoma sublateritium (strain FD-334 SS-4) TaxID=945553 RepID=A0A0D2MTI9_HYPSF|nr:hypothetical protein HYPSUDRAFT_131263 [Hypholoma sublateritium FD-334 SS-4]
MENREDIPRVSVDSVQDWKQVRGNYEKAALSKLEEQVMLRGMTAEKEAIKAHLQQFVEKTFILAQPNLRVNGHSFESLDENGRVEMELFDETLDRRIWSLADTRLQWHKRIAETRRTIPMEIESTLSVLLVQHGELDPISLPPSMDEADEQPSSDTGGQIEDALQSTSALAHELSQTVSRQQERGDRVKDIAADVKSLKP